MYHLYIMGEGKGDILSDAQIELGRIRRKRKYEGGSNRELGFQSKLQKAGLSEYVAEKAAQAVTDSQEARGIRRGRVRRTD